MKNQKKKKKSLLSFLLITAALALAILPACQREQIDQNQVSAVKGGGVEPSDFIENAQNAEDQVVNQCLYDIGIASRDILRNSEVKLAVISAAAATNHGEVDLLSVLNQQGFLSDFSDALATQTGNDPTTFDAEAYISDHLTYDETYIAKVKVVNGDVLDDGEDAWIAAGIQINENEYPDNEDDILVWKHPNNTYSLEILDESDAISAENPVFIIINGETLANEEIFDDPGAATTMTRFPAGSFPRWKATSIGITQRYEESGDTDFTIAIRDASEYPGIGATTMYGFESSWSPSQIGTTRSYNTPLIEDPASKLSAFRANWATYEVDWYAGLHWLFTCTNYYGATESVKTKRKYIHEWYHHGGTNNYNWVALHPTHNSSNNINDGKGVFTMTRINY
jgi:hypothetical protein